MIAAPDSQHPNMPDQRPLGAAVFAGTFDPLTSGHADLVRRSVGLFGRVVLAVAVAHHKKTLFSLDERLALARAALADLGDALSVCPFEGLLRDFVRAQGARVVVRGVRSASDFDYEAQLAGMNRRLMPEVETVFLPPADAHQFVSGTLVREIALLGGEVQALVPPAVLPYLLAKVGRTGPVL